MVRIEEIVEMVIVIAHRSRIAFEDACQFDEFVPHEVLLLRALLRAGQQKKGRELARVLGWSPGRVTQVVNVLVEKGQVVREKTVSITGKGASEAEGATHLLRSVADTLLAGVDEGEREALVVTLRRVAANSEALWRITRSAS